MMLLHWLLLKVNFYHMQHYIRLISHFLIATLCTFILASLMHSQFVLHELSEIGVTIAWSIRLSTSLDDLLGLSSGYGPIIAIALLIGFSLMAVIRYKGLITTPWLYPLAGLLAMMTMLLAMQPILNITLIAGARSPLGFAAQCLSGFVGGWVFMRLRHAIITNKRQLKVALKRS